MTLNEPIFDQIPLFATLPLDELRYLTQTLRQIAIPGDTVLFREGDKGDHLYIVLEGRLEIVKALGTEDELLLSMRGPGEFVGEMSLVTGDGLRTASVRSSSPAQLLEIPRADFDQLLYRHPALAFEMLRVLSSRLRDSNNATIRDLQEKNRQITQAYQELQAAQAQIIEKEILERELQVAREIQEDMLPRNLPRLPGFDFGALMVPARMVAGDLFDFIPLDHDTIGIVVADVCGKGVAAALHMALTRSLIRAEARRAPTALEAVQSVNQHLLDMSDAGIFVTLLYGVLYRTTREFAYVRAGHELPLVVDPRGDLIIPSMGQGQPLGILPNPDLNQGTITIPQGGTLLLYTDGVTEALDMHGSFFEAERLYKVAHANRETSAQELCERLLQAVTQYRGAALQADDVTLVAVRAQ
jgi:sigma-B regulation protein RsbU (phosphoserine phosphatase)